VDEFAEIAYKMLFCARIAPAEVFKIYVVELMELQSVILKINFFDLEKRTNDAKLSPGVV